MIAPSSSGMRSCKQRQRLSLDRALCCAFEQLRWAFNSCGDDGTIDKAKLKKESRRVPINMLACNLAVLESNDGDQEKFSSPAGRGYAGQHPVHLERMREPHHVLCYDVRLSENLGNRQQLQVGRNTRQKLASVKLAHALLTRASAP